jgi:curli production assembly/transport component CsgG
MVLRLLSLFLLATLLSSCVSIEEIEPPKNVSAPLVDELRNMPPPKRKVPVAVYKFNDVTGQRKSGNNLALLSSAVTQGYCKH